MFGVAGITGVACVAGVGFVAVIGIGIGAREACVRVDGSGWWNAGPCS